MPSVLNDSVSSSRLKPTCVSCCGFGDDIYGNTCTRCNGTGEVAGDAEQVRRNTFKLLTKAEFVSLYGLNEWNRQNAAA